MSNSSPSADDLFSASLETLFRVLESSPSGLTSDRAKELLIQSGADRLRSHPPVAGAMLLLRQFSSPIILILIAAAILSGFLGDSTDVGIIIAIVLASGLLGFWQEKTAGNAVAKLSAVVEVKARVLRDGAEVLLPIKQIVPGDVLIFCAGALIPADCRLREARDLFVNEAALTGETYPVEKTPGTIPSTAALAHRTNALFMGTHVVSGSAQAIVVRTGRATEFGKVYERLKLRQPETEFEHGIRRFGYLLAEMTFLLVLAIFAFNVYFHKPVLDSFLFALALAVGLTPQLLPAIISVNLAHGARRMAKQKVIVKRLAAIENFGSMDVLCADKTGTLTEGEVQVHSALDPQGNANSKVLLYAYLNAANETGFVNPIDEAIQQADVGNTSDWQKLDEIPYDFLRKRLSVLLENKGRRVVIAKGALRQILDVSSRAEISDGSIVPIDSVRAEVERHWRTCSNEGHRVLAVAYRDCGEQKLIARSDETNMIFLGLIVLSDPPKAGIAATIRELNDLGIALKIITGDNTLIAQQIARGVGFDHPQILTGDEMRNLSAQALTQRAPATDLFVEIEPAQKERIILALKKAGHVVGYIGDGINDAPALHAADVGLSVDSAVDVAREAADFVLLEHDLEVLVDGVREGRRTFANTMKYIFIATSANFGNMFSMAGASLFLPFLPLLPKQILLINLLTDLPEMTIAGDNVDPDLVQEPRRWDIRFIRKFMLVFGILSSVFDCLTFALLIWLGATMEQFRTGWFIESVVSASLIVLVIRTRRPFFKSLPSKLLAVATGCVVLATFLMPQFQWAPLLGFTPLPGKFYGIVGAIVILYVIAAEIAKRVFYGAAAKARKTS